MPAEPEAEVYVGPLRNSERKLACYKIGYFPPHHPVHVCPCLAVDSSKQVGCCTKLPGMRLQVETTQLQAETVIVRVLTPAQCPHRPVPSAIGEPDYLESRV